MNVTFRGSFLRDLKKLKDPHVRAQIKAAIEALEGAIDLSDLTNVRKMSGGGSYYRIRIGDYRIGLSVQGEDVEVVRVLHRKDIYRYFP